MRVSYPVIYRPKTLDDLKLVQSGQEGAWCGNCAQVTVFTLAIYQRFAPHYLTKSKTRMCSQIMVDHSILSDHPNRSCDSVI